MKFTELSVTELSNKPERVLLDGFTIKFNNGPTITLDGQWVEIVGPESDNFKEADLSVRRDLIMGVKLTQTDIDQRIKSSLVVNWSFEDPCTPENLVAAFKIWPKNLIDHIIKMSEARVTANFPKQKSKN